jgi:hypothetical protein
VHCASTAGTAARQLLLPGDRAAVRDGATTAALHLALGLLRGA